jgi:hypothetical protein
LHLNFGASRIRQKDIEFIDAGQAADQVEKRTPTPLGLSSGDRRP